ncbi:BZ3500_MvSof-1268-A1-R1_Chr1-3g01829 [Microbotryum saponariae]|uniref:BZ3500_MvSof-1268-A1-R1_Chr1-3g01829 protein n=1 Tax=Microbotryum saponariae TaxID=289078 RepID=A0A2X0M7Z0_9BASI|nr:BZ3500_MvSof-1268-A1-R1_Chr1-3g01829 [Microbotryum saponariae]SCZ94690.1 BZ3501_MvSof-1269-A2-R1_Chr1-3g01431 [Microbotryum saponariae]
MSSQKEIKLPMFTEHQDPMSSKSMMDTGMSESKLSMQAPPQHVVSKTEPTKIWPGYIIMIWICLSSGVIIQNAWILRTLKFDQTDRVRELTLTYICFAHCHDLILHPIFLTTWHLVFATIGTRLLLRFTHLLDGIDALQMSWDRWFRNIVPIGALFSASLIFSNLAYLTLSVSFIQMLKAFTSVAVLGLSVVAGLEKMNPRTFMIVIAISSGVALASFGEIDFVLSGFICQTLGIMFEAARLVSIQKLLTGLKMGPLQSLYFFAPVCAGLNALLIPFFEGWAPFENALSQVGAPILLGNAMTAFSLNVAVVFLIGCASSLVLTLSGVVKDILLVGGSVLLMGSTVTFTQMLGYSIALVGLFVFKTKQEVLDHTILRVRGLLSGGR